MPRSSAFFSVGTSASGSFADTAIASTRCAMSEFNVSICPSAVGVVGPTKITSASSSLPASSAPLWTASKKPLPSDFATMPTRVRPGGCGPPLPQATSNTAQAAATKILRDNPPPSGRSGALLHLVRSGDLGDEGLDARRPETLELLRSSAIVRDYGVDAIQTRHDHRGLAAQLGAVR